MAPGRQSFLGKRLLAAEVRLMTDAFTINVINAVVAKQMTSKDIFTFEYLKFLITDSSLGKRSVGMIGSPHRLERAIPRQSSR